MTKTVASLFNAFKHLCYFLLTNDKSWLGLFVQHLHFNCKYGFIILNINHFRWSAVIFLENLQGLMPGSTAAKTPLAESVPRAEAWSWSLLRPANATMSPFFRPKLIKASAIWTLNFNNSWFDVCFPDSAFTWSVVNNNIIVNNSQ